MNRTPDRTICLRCGELLNKHRLTDSAALCPKWDTQAASVGVSPDLKDEVLLKAIKLLEALSEPCTEVGGADHSWRLCRRCMAIRQFDFAPRREAIAAAIRQQGQEDR